MSTTKNQIIKAIEEATGVKNLKVESPENEEFGDYTTNAALQIWSNFQFPISNFQSKFKIPRKAPLRGKQNSKFKNARELAEDMAKRLKENRELSRVVEKIEVAGPGFINFWLTRSVLVRELSKIVEEGENYGSSDLGKGKTVLVEYSSPNIAKQFSVGHLRSTTIGQCLYNIFKFLGYKVIGENHLGDWGTQFGTIIASIKKKGLDVEKLSLDELETLYVEFNKLQESDPSLHEEAKLWFKRLEERESAARNIWEKAKKISLEEFQKIYDLLEVSIDNAHGESFYEDKMPSVIEEVRKRGLSKPSQGAEIIEFKDLPPAMLLKSDATTTYFTRDLAALKFRIETWDPEILVYEVGVEQSLHFKQVFAAAKLLGWTKGKALVHIGHGLFLFEGKKMSTRRGTTIKLVQVLEESIQKARSIIESSGTGRGLDEKGKQEVAKAVGIGAIKYFDLSHHPTSNINFSWDHIFALEGNSGPYLQYTVARTNSVINKAAGTRQQAIDIKELVTSLYREAASSVYSLAPNSEELAILRSLLRFSEIVADSARNHSPNLLCTYLYMLAQKYNNFYNQFRIIGSENQDFRLAMTTGVGQVLKSGLKLLGIKTPERM